MQSLRDRTKKKLSGFLQHLFAVYNTESIYRNEENNI